MSTRDISRRRIHENRELHQLITVANLNSRFWVFRLNAKPFKMFESKYVKSEANPVLGEILPQKITCEVFYSFQVEDDSHLLPE